MTGVEAFAYRAFLSYSHRDTRWAKRLHRALEGFRVDKDLVGRKTPAGPVPDTLRPIFRDREDFTAGESLNDQSVAALEASQFLIVICSPAAAGSRYVNEEVRRFKVLGRADRVIPVIVDGEPGQGDRECFPPALRLEVTADGNLIDRPTELLAADVRETGDGWNLAVAKVVAGLLGLSTDEVYRRAERDRRRQGRIRFGIVAAILALAVLGGVFAWRDHDKQQTLAEVETLVARYTPAGEADAAGPGARQSLTEAITAIAQGAASDPRYRKALDLIEANKPAEAEPLLKAVAEDKKKLAAKQNKEAAEAFRNLAAIARISDPANARTYYAEAASLDPKHVEGLYWHGEMQREAGALDEAETAFRGVIGAVKEGRDDTWLYWARLGLGDLRVARGDLNGARTVFEEAGEFVRSLAAADPGNAGWQRDLSVSHNKIGDVLVGQGNLADALESYRASLAIRERLAAADPGNAGWQRDLSVSHNKIGDVLVGQGNLADALESYRASMLIAERLAAADPGNAGWQRDLAISNERIGDMHARQGRTEEATAAFERALEAYAKLLARNPDDVQSRVFSVVPLLMLGELKGKDGRKDFEAALAILKPLADANRLDAMRRGWIGQIEARIAELGE